MPDALDHLFSRAILEGNSHLALLQAKCVTTILVRYHHPLSTTFVLGTGWFGDRPLCADLFKRRQSWGQTDHHQQPCGL